MSPMTRQEAFSILGLSPDATPVQIRNRWRKLAMQYHPDKNPGNKSAEERFKQINMAHNIIAAPYVENTTTNATRAKTSHAETSRKSGRKTFQDFIDYINMLVADLETLDLNDQGRKQLQEIKQTLQVAIRMHRFINCAYFSSIVGMLGMFAYNQIFGYDAPHIGLVVYPLIGVAVVLAAITQDKFTAKTSRVADLIRIVLQNTR